MMLTGGMELAEGKSNLLETGAGETAGGVGTGGVIAAIGPPMPVVAAGGGAAGPAGTAGVVEASAALPPFAHAVA